jgi:hypothetical protein
VTAGLGPEPDAKQSATKVTDRYIGHLISGQPYRAVDECFDAAAFNKKVFGKEVDKLTPSEAAYLKQLTVVMMKTAITAMPPQILRDGKMSEGKVQGEGETLKISYTFTLPAEKTRTGKPYSHVSTFVVEQTSKGWKIVDMEPFASLAGKGYKRFSPGTASPIFFMEGMISGVLESKFETREKIEGGGQVKPVSGRGTTTSSATRAAQQGNIRAQAKSMQNQIELYKARTGQYPDLIKNGWQVLIKGGYIKRAPVNPVNNRADICAGNKGRADKGWHYEVETGTFGASYFDEATQELTPSKP